MSFSIYSRAFQEGNSIPVVHSCDGDDISPPLSWEDVPKGAVSLALIMDDPDAPNGTFTHWILYNIPTSTEKLEKIVPIQKKLDNGMMQGQNDFGKIGYGGPCPPQGEEHRYYFRLLALNNKLQPESANSRADFNEAIKDHILEETTYYGVYRRP